MADSSEKVLVSRTDPLKTHGNDLQRFMLALMSVAEGTPERMSVGQLIFFMQAGMADLRGTPATFTEIKDSLNPSFSRTMHTTYKLLLEGKRKTSREDKPYMDGMGWLKRIEDPLDNRRKYLHLTPTGREVLREMLLAMGD